MYIGITLTTLTERKLMKVLGYLNIYRSGYYHRKGKPGKIVTPIPFGKVGIVTMLPSETPHSLED